MDLMCVINFKRKHWALFVIVKNEHLVNSGIDSMQWKSGMTDHNSYSV